ncbi:PulJ/GspJ family protein [Hydrogenophilus thiooxidans]|uniref:PulJ/GspJ family protein n=1 Tax=Hydrogenophilus thiooxidans TaxID=2820326 RepID=UPI001C236D5B|nr:type II secretion system protein [Hydrogenophilus thiooxidans]
MRAPAAKGFTLIEMVAAMVILGVVAAIVAVVFRPALESFFDVRSRAALTDMADTALRRIADDLRHAVPNSIVAHSLSCVQFSPTVGGGRYRIAPDPGNSMSDPLELDNPNGDSSFDALTPLPPGLKIHDWVVVGNTDATLLASGASRAQISQITLPSSAIARYRIALTAPKQFPSGYSGGRFQVVPNNQQSLFYHCVGNTLYRTVAYFTTGSGQCSTTSGSVVVATDVAACRFDYQPASATQAFDYLWLELTLTRRGETVTLGYGVHVSNAP